MKARRCRLEWCMHRPAGVWWFACLSALALSLAFAPTARAGYYKMVACAADNGTAPYTATTNTISGQNPNGIFEFHDWCGGQGGDPPGEAAYLRINEREPSGNAGQWAFGAMTFSTPANVHFLTAGGYTREPNAFNEGWRARFWSPDANAEFMLQGNGAPTPISATFGPHLWPLSYYLSFNQFVFELLCVRAVGCDRTNYNATDANGFVFLLNDDSNSSLELTTTSPFMGGQWVKGDQAVTFNVADLGSGLRWERMRVDGGQVWTWDHAPECNVTWSQTNGEWARTYQPCPTGGPWPRAVGLSTSGLADGAHTVQVCSQDYGQYEGLQNTGSETCDARTIHVDNTAPAAPLGLWIQSENQQRYLSHFGAHWSLPPNAGSPIKTVHYDIVNGAGEVVVPERSVSPASTADEPEPVQLPDIEGPAQPGDYRLRVWLEDSVGLVGPAATAPIPHDTTPPAAPQDVSVTAPTESRASQGFDVRWHNVIDAGAPIDAVHYEVLRGSGDVAVPTQTVAGDNVQAISNLESPQDPGQYVLRMWLSDAEGNVGAPVSAPLAYDCVRSDAGSGTALTSSLGAGGSSSEVVPEGTGSALHGTIRDAGGNGVATAHLCVFSRVVTDPEREFLGIAVSGPNGAYQFPVEAGASRNLSVVYRRDHRELVSHATIETVVHPILGAKRKVVYNKHFVHFFGAIPGPHNDRVVIVLQARVGKGWTAFRRYRTRENGRFALNYRFRHTYRRTTYVMRAQVRQTVGYPYLQGNSDLLRLLVLPRQPRRSR